MPPPPDRSALSPRAIVRDLWTTTLGLPAALLDPTDPDPDPDSDSNGSSGPLVLPGLDGETESTAGVDTEEPALPSSFRIGALAQSVVALAGLTAALVDATRAPASTKLDTETAADAKPGDAPQPASASSPPASAPDTRSSNNNNNSSAAQQQGSNSEGRIRLPKVTVPLRHAVAEFHSERIYTLTAPSQSSSSPSATASSSLPSSGPAPAPPASVHGPVGGLYATPLDGSAVRIHDALPNHARAALDLLGLGGDGPAGAGSKSKGKQHGTDGDSKDDEGHGVGSVSREDIARRVALHTSAQLEHLAHDTPSGAVLYALRSYKQWDAHPQAAHTPDTPILIRRISSPSSSSSGPKPLPPAPNPSPSPSLSSQQGDNHQQQNQQQQHHHPHGCLSGLRVLELSRIIAAPTAGRTLAAHSASILWLTSPTLPSLPALDVDLSRGKRTIQLDLSDPAQRDTLHALVRDADVFIQGYRPGSLAARAGLSPEALARVNPHIVVANLSAFGPEGPWAGRRGFDSLVQTCTGMNVSEAAHRAGRDDDDERGHGSEDHREEDTGAADQQGGHGTAPAALPMPCQALDHASGHLLASGICTALHRRATHGGAYTVDVSLAATARYLRSLGQYSRARGFTPAAEARRVRPPGHAHGQLDGKPDNHNEGCALPPELFETRESGLGTLTALRHSAAVEGRRVGWHVMPKPLGSDEPRWV
ncbi:CoA-transferase family III [Purpureocillium lilacinum]|uniref:CoA-transferase family III n=1 Tax=Purpureocillium lilacinum TaxID=33203 RepID=A0A179FWL6_PURLI|nr:CoA-transferase family III [Purpureocillium lilacinum]